MPLQVQLVAAAVTASLRMQVRPPMPAVFFFVLDVTAGAVSSGMLAIACETIKGALDGLPGGERTHIGFLTFDAHLHFYNLSEARQGTAVAGLFWWTTRVV